MRSKVAGRRHYTVAVNGDGVADVRGVAAGPAVYAQAVTPAKRKAQGKVVAMLRNRDIKTG